MQASNMSVKLGDFVFSSHQHGRVTGDSLLYVDGMCVCIALWEGNVLAGVWSRIKTRLLYGPAFPGKAIFRTHSGVLFAI